MKPGFKTRELWIFPAGLRDGLGTARKLIGLVLLLALAVSGCASKLNKITTSYPGGQTVIQEISDEALYYQVQTQMAAARKPILVMEAKPGERIELKGVKRLVVWGYAGDRGRMRAYEHPWAKAVREWGGIVGMLGGIYVGGYWANQLADTVGRHAGTTTTITDSYNGDHVGGDQIGGDNIGGDWVGGDKIGGDWVGGDKIGGDRNDNDTTNPVPGSPK